jgi:hypothetical protein
MGFAEYMLTDLAGVQRSTADWPTLRQGGEIAVRPP